MTAKVKINLNITGARQTVKAAASSVLKDITIEIAQYAVHHSPWRFGTNARSIDYIHKELTSSIFSTSGYGGYLETGTVHMAARPYFKPGLDMFFTKERFARGMRELL